MPGRDGTGPLGHGARAGRGSGKAGQGQGRGIGKSRGFGLRQSSTRGMGWGLNESSGLAVGRGQRFRLGNGACLNPQVDTANEQPGTRGSRRYRMVSRLN